MQTCLFIDKFLYLFHLFNDANYVYYFSYSDIYCTHFGTHIWIWDIYICIMNIYDVIWCLYVLPILFPNEMHNYSSKKNCAQNIGGTTWLVIWDYQSNTMQIYPLLNIHSFKIDTRFSSYGMVCSLCVFFLVWWFLCHWSETLVEVSKYKFDFKSPVKVAFSSKSFLLPISTQRYFCDMYLCQIWYCPVQNHVIQCISVVALSIIPYSWHTLCYPCRGLIAIILYHTLQWHRHPRAGWRI